MNFSFYNDLYFLFVYYVAVVGNDGQQYTITLTNNDEHVAINVFCSRYNKILSVHTVKYNKLIRIN